jgi:hypothetical protein
VSGCSEPPTERLTSSADASISVLLLQRREKLSLLKSRWANPMVSLDRFESHVHYARLISEQISQSSLLPLWPLNQSTIVIEELSTDSGDFATDVPLEDELEDDQLNLCNTSENLFTDILDEDIVEEASDDESIPDGVSDQDPIPVIWALPVSDPSHLFYCSDHERYRMRSVSMLVSSSLSTINHTHLIPMTAK